MFHVVDDDVIILEILKEIIIDADFDVLCFESGKHYLNHLNSSAYQQPIAILSDVDMPDMTGHEMALHVRQQYAQQRIVFITGKPDMIHRQVSAQLQCYTLDKPFLPDRLIALLHALHACEENCSGQNNASYHQQCDLALAKGCPFHDTPNNSDKL